MPIRNWVNWDQQSVLDDFWDIVADLEEERKAEARKRVLDHRIEGDRLNRLKRARPARERYLSF